MKRPARHTKSKAPDDPAQLRRRAEARLTERHRDEKSDAATQRLLHELEVHQIELELQNAELQKVRDELEVTVEKYTDLYDFAPAAYFSLDESGLILEANLTGAALLGVARSRLINRRLLLFVSPASRPVFADFLKKVFAESKVQSCEAVLLKEGGGTFLAGFRATSAVSLKGMPKWCRVAFGDITARKEADEVRRRAEALANTNLGLNREIARRRKVEKALKTSQRQQEKTLEQSRHMQEQLRHLSHQLLHATEEERKRISRELHDEIAQTLVGINVHLAALTRGAGGNHGGIRRKIARTQKLVEKSVGVVHQFARELRPPALDDLGLVPALHTFMKDFTKRTGLHIHFRTFTSGSINNLDSATRTVFYRVAQEALTNVARHAKASRVEVSFEKLPGAIRLKIRDDGKSFDVQRTLQANRGKRLGLLGMRERLEMVGGRYAVESSPGQGTTVIAQIPFAPSRKAKKHAGKNEG